MLVVLAEDANQGLASAIVDEAKQLGRRIRSCDQPGEPSSEVVQALDEFFRQVRDDKKVEKSGADKGRFCPVGGRQKS